jgi:kynurenine formamidase
MTACVHDHSRWGAGDQIGAGNLLTPERRLAALRLAREGRLLDLSHVIETGAPRIDPPQDPYVISISATSRNGVRRRRALGATNDAGTNLERIEMTTHVGTHIDALGHCSIGDRLYNGFSADEVVGDRGLTHLGVEHIPPIVTRGVLLDVAGLDGGAHLDRGRAVDADDLKRAADRAGVAVTEGDVVCIRTGWGRFFMADNARYLSGEPGIELGAARWLTERGVVAIGCDNMAVEVVPGTDHPRTILPVHQHALAEAGVYLVENLALEEAAAQSLSAFCFILLPVKFRGATGCPVRPIAML